MKIRSLMTPPPGGFFFYELNGERVQARLWPDMEPMVRALMQKHGVVGSPAAVVSEFMCPSMPDWYCSGPNLRHVLRIPEIRENAGPYFHKQIVPFDVVSRRLRCCQQCPKHTRNFCLTCTGLSDWIMVSFNNRRTRVPEDQASGTCECAKTLEAVIATVDYADSDPVWDGVPDTCWRKTK